MRFLGLPVSQMQRVEVPNEIVQTTAGECAGLAPHKLRYCSKSSRRLPLCRGFGLIYLNSSVMVMTAIRLK